MSRLFICSRQNYEYIRHSSREIVRNLYENVNFAQFPHNNILYSIDYNSFITLSAIDTEIFSPRIFSPINALRLDSVPLTTPIRVVS